MDDVPRLSHSQPISDSQVLDYWQWAHSDLLSNLERAIFGEYLVGLALDVTAGTTRKEWNKIDLTYQEKFIEVKTTGLLQRWEKAKNPSNRFDIAKKYPYEWGLPDADYSGGKIRAAHVYVFCVFDPQDDGGEITDVNQWHFFVFPRTLIESLWGNQDSVSLNVVKQICIQIGFDKIKKTVDRALEAFN
ncbi:MAG: hypothetical protein ACXV5H_12060 [Halobacteriota archaeon]